MKITIGTRGSHLALWQANFIQSKLAEIGVEAELQIIKTQGDLIQNVSLSKLEGKGFFTKELEDALLNGAVDLAVHSLKDMPTTQPEGLVLAATSYRENPADWMLIRPEAHDPQQPLQLRASALVGTSSFRRKLLLQDLRPDLRTEDLRGNVPTRVQRLANGDFDAIILAAAGLSRLNLDLSGFQVVALNPREFIPAPAQGVLGLQVRADDLPLRRALLALHHPEVSSCTNIERKLLQLLEGGCHAPFGAYCTRDEQGHFHAVAAYAPVLGEPIRRVRLSSATNVQMAERMFAMLRS